MAEYRVFLLPAARRDLEQIADYHLEKVGAASAERITDAILDTVDLLGLFPFMGAPLPDPVLSKQEYRKVICRDYVCIYRILTNEIFVYRIVHGSRDYPRYFK